jgi:photosystem II stability/assembly factor-like uncharacterized protein
MTLKIKLIAAAVTLAATFSGSLALAAGSASSLTQQHAVVSPSALRTGILAVARAGQRIVAVGDRGVVLLSDDNGVTFRQSAGVPTRAMLTSVSFAEDGRTGWAVGHLGVILVTRNAGDTWHLQRDDLVNDQPLFATSFTSATDGFAAGLWSLLVRTQDGGKSWETVNLAAATGGKAGGSGPNLFSIVRSVKGTLLIASEQGVVFRSTDNGANWTAVQTGNAGTFWACQSLRSGTLLAAGLGGKVYRSTDDGVSWQPVAVATRSSITALAQLPSDRVVGVGADGAMLVSHDDGVTFQATHLRERTELTAVLANGRDTAIVFSSAGPLAPAKGFAAQAGTPVAAK